MYSNVRIAKIKEEYKNAKQLLALMHTENTYVRRSISQKLFLLWALYYFEDTFVYPLADFHYEMVNDLKFNPQRFITWAEFRGSAKTSFAKMYITYCICEEVTDFILYDSFELDVAKGHLYDISVWLQTNPRILEDYGQLYFESVEDGDEKRSKLKSIKAFVTKNNIKVQAISTRKTARGHTFNNKRPGLWVMDDFETEQTIESNVFTHKVISHIDTARTALAPGGKMLFLCNYICTTGSVEYLRRIAMKDPANWTFRRVDAETTNLLNERVPTWPGKYTMTDAQALIENYNLPENRPPKVSLESEKRTMNAGGKKLYEQEMLQQPMLTGQLWFSTEAIKVQEPRLQEPLHIAGKWKIWEHFIPGARYAIGGDTGGGQEGSDPNAACIIKFGNEREHAKVVATFVDDTIDAKAFGKEMMNMGRLYGICLLAPEINNMGYATVYEIRDNYPLSKLYHRVKKDEAKIKKTDKLGFYTTGDNKPDILMSLRSAVESGELIIQDPNLYSEISVFSFNDAVTLPTNNNTTKHYDLTMALAIGWEMRKYAMASQREQEYNQKIEEFDPHQIFS